MARNVMQKRWNGTDYEEIHPITKASNVFASNDKSVEDMVRDRLSYGVTTGTSTALSVTLNPIPTMLEAGFRVTVKVNAGGTGQTLDVNDIGAKAIKNPNGTSAVLVTAGVYTLVYDGLAFILQGEGGDSQLNAAALTYTGQTVIGDIVTSKDISLFTFIGSMQGYIDELQFVCQDSGGSWGSVSLMPQVADFYKVRSFEMILGGFRITYETSSPGQIIEHMVSWPVAQPISATLSGTGEVTVTGTFTYRP